MTKSPFVIVTETHSKMVAVEWPKKQQTVDREPPTIFPYLHKETRKRV